MTTPVPVDLTPLRTKWLSRPERADELRQLLANPVMKEALTIVAEAFRPAGAKDPLPGESAEATLQRMAFSHYETIGADRALLVLESLTNPSALSAPVLERAWSRPEDRTA